MADRRYVLTKVGPGDYLLPGNDGKSLWRIARVEGDGWDLWRRYDGMTGALDLDWSHWELCEQCCARREDAIRRAVEMSD